MPDRCPICGRSCPSPAPERPGELAFDDLLAGDLRPGLDEILAAKVVPIEQLAGVRILREHLCPGCGRLPD